MKITITKEFSSPAEAVAWLRTVGGEPTSQQTITINAGGNPDEAQPDLVRTAVPGSVPVRVDTPVPPAPVKKLRKSRSDAGQPRGPYKTTGEPAVSEPGTMPNSVGATPAAPVAPTQSAAPEEKVTPAKSAPSVAADSTLDGARAALKRLNETEGLGMPACMEHLKQFGVNRISSLDPKMFELFVKQADQKIAEHKGSK